MRTNAYAANRKINRYRLHQRVKLHFDLYSLLTNLTIVCVENFTIVCSVIRTLLSLSLLTLN